MRYAFFEIENFKGIRAARLDLAPADSRARVYTIVGLNESGKTTVLAAIDHFQSASDKEISPKQVAGWLPLDTQLLIPIAERTNFTGSITIRCGIELNEEDVEATRAHLRNLDGYRLEELDRTITITDRYQYEDSRFVNRSSSWRGLAGRGRTKKGRVERPLARDTDKVRWNAVTAFIRSRLPTIWFFENFLFDFPERIYIEEYEGETPANRFYRALFQDILSALPRDLDVEKHVVERVRSGKASDRENYQQVLLSASRDVTNTVVSSWNRIFRDKPMSEKRVAIDLGEDDAEGVNDPGEPNPSKLWVRFRIEDSDGLFAVSERSLGFRWFFVYLLLTTYRGRRKGASGEMLFLFDEPASNLHPTAQKALLASIAELSEKAVIIYTTHSHHLIEPKWLGTTFVAANRGLDAEAVSADFNAEQTDIHVTPYRQFASQHPKQAHYFQPILDVLDYAPSELELVPDAVMIEGKTDFYLLAYFQEVVRGVSGGSRIHLMPGGGAGTLDELIQLYVGWSRPFVALLDSDKEGRSQLNRYLEKFGEIVRPHLVELSEASGKTDAKGIESLLYDSDKLRFQALVEPNATKYRKKTLALGVQEALVAKEPVKMTLTAERALEKTLQTLRARLVEVKELTTP
jgi:hypothetical protein